MPHHRPAHHLAAHMVGVIVGGQGGGQRHVVGCQDVEDALGVIRRVDHHCLAGFAVAHQIGEVDHLGSHLVAHGKVAARQQLAEVEPVGVGAARRPVGPGCRSGFSCRLLA